MSELEANSDSSGAADATRAIEAKPDSATATGASATNADGSGAASSTTGETAESKAPDDNSKPANIVLYSHARAKAEAERAEQAKASAFNARTRWASRKVSRIVAVAAIAAAIGSISGALATLGV